MSYDILYVQWNHKSENQNASSTTTIKPQARHRVVMSCLCIGKELATWSTISSFVGFPTWKPIHRRGNRIVSSGALPQVSCSIHKPMAQPHTSFTMSNIETQAFFTIEVYNRMKWSDKYSCTYSTFAEAEDRARELYNEEAHYANHQNVDPIHTCYRIKENINTSIIHELQWK